MRRLHLLMVGVALLTASASVPAAEPDVPPSVVGRLNLVSGEVTFRLLSDPSWSAADFNYPVYTGMTLSTGTLARAEIGIGPNALQMSSETQIEMATLSERLVDIVVQQGHIYLSLHQLHPGDTVELEPPSGSVWLLQSGRYEIDLGVSDAPGYVVVLDGKARFLGNNADLGIAAGQQAMLTGPDNVTVTPANQGTVVPPAAPASSPNAPPTPPSSAAAPPDEFMQWAEARDTLPISDAPANVTRDTSGYDMLDAYGDWKDSDAYGRVWIPSEVPADWQPYRYGHWVSIAPCGPTWVDDQPWGFVPFHYGRWAMVDSQWAWVPGDPTQPEVYAPALVAFLGSPDQVLAVDDSGQAAVGWVPLAPGEPYYPWYPADVVYFERVNAANVREFRHLSPDRIEALHRADTSREFANRRFATVVNHATFAGARPVAAGMVHVSAERLARASAMAGAPRLDPGQGRRPAEERVVTRGPEQGAHGGSGPAGRPGTPAQGMAANPATMHAAPGASTFGRSAPGMPAGRSGQAGMAGGGPKPRPGQPAPGMPAGRSGQAGMVSGGSNPSAGFRPGQPMVPTRFQQQQAFHVPNAARPAVRAAPAPAAGGGRKK